MRRLPVLSITVVLVSTATGIAINVASNAANGWLSRPWILWPLLAAACALTIVLDVTHARRAQGDHERQLLHVSERMSAQVMPASPPRRSDTVLVDASVDDRLLVHGVWSTVRRWTSSSSTAAQSRPSCTTSMSR
jgi:hypothetical protein